MNPIWNSGYGSTRRIKTLMSKLFQLFVQIILIVICLLTLAGISLIWIDHYGIF